MIYSDGSKYTGGWKEDAYHGEGEYLGNDGSRYKGEWNYNKKHGYGEL